MGLCVLSHFRNVSRCHFVISHERLVYMYSNGALRCPLQMHWVKIRVGRGELTENNTLPPPPIYHHNPYLPQILFRPVFGNPGIGTSLVLTPVESND